MAAEIIVVAAEITVVAAETTLVAVEITAVAVEITAVEAVTMDAIRQFSKRFATDFWTDQTAVDIRVAVAMDLPIRIREAIRGNHRSLTSKALLIKVRINLHIAEHQDTSHQLRIHPRLHIRVRIHPQLRRQVHIPILIHQHLVEHHFIAYRFQLQLHNRSHNLLRPQFNNLNKHRINQHSNNQLRIKLHSQHLAQIHLHSHLQTRIKHLTRLLMHTQLQTRIKHLIQLLMHTQLQIRIKHLIQLLMDTQLQIRIKHLIKLLMDKQLRLRSQHLIHLHHLKLMNDLKLPNSYLLFLQSLLIISP